MARAGQALRLTWQRVPLAADQGGPLTTPRGFIRLAPASERSYPCASRGQGTWSCWQPWDRTAVPVLAECSCGQTKLTPGPWRWGPRLEPARQRRCSGGPIGWGGSFGNRDCSALMKGLFTPFGLWLPRNSTGAGQGGDSFLPLEHQEPLERKRVILKQGVPLLTLVWRPGHIIFYLGAYQGRAMVMHSFWRPKAIDGDGREGRQVIGRAVITSLQAGEDLPQLARPERLLRNRVEDLTQRVPPADLRGSAPALSVRP
ncbi:hypothetical protein DFAR_750007 [Desulfarculales bacterium]